MESAEPQDQTLGDQLLLARMLLRPIKGRDAAWPALAAAAFFAASAMTFAVTAIMTPAHDYRPAPAQNDAPKAPSPVKPKAA